MTHDFLASLQARNDKNGAVNAPAPETSPQRDARRSQLLDVALGLFGQKGYHATSIADMARKISVRARLPDSAEVLVSQV